MSSGKKLRLGTRTSQLALWQTDYVMDRLQHAWPGLVCKRVPFVTKGDRILDQTLPAIGGKGLFTVELEAALRQERIDLAVHSLKDLPVENAPGLVIGAIPPRASVGDVLVARNGWTVDTLPEGAVVGTSSLRRAAQLRRYRPDLTIRPIRGNVETRVRKALHGDYDAVVLAAAGLERLEMDEVISEYLPPDIMLPAPGQGALGIQCRADDEETLEFLAAIHHAPTAAAVTAERHFLHTLDGGCSTPIGARAEGDPEMKLRARVSDPAGRRLVEVNGAGEDPLALAEALAEEARQKGAMEIVRRCGGPLRGKRVVVTRPRAQADALVEPLLSQGTMPLLVPTIRVAPLEDLTPLHAALDAIDRYDWLILTSRNGVEIFVDILLDRGQALDRMDSVRVAVVGPKTAEALADAGRAVDFIPSSYDGATLGAELPLAVGAHVLLPRAAQGGSEIVDLLRSRGATVEDLPIYDTIQPEISAADIRAARGADLLTFTSGSTARHFVDAVGEPLPETPAVCIGPATAATARDLGLNVVGVADPHTIEGLIQAAHNYFATVETS